MKEENRSTASEVKKSNTATTVAASSLVVGILSLLMLVVSLVIYWIPGMREAADIMWKVFGIIACIALAAFYVSGFRIPRGDTENESSK